MRKILCTFFIFSFLVTQFSCTADSELAPTTIETATQEEQLAGNYSNPVLNASSDPEVFKAADGLYYLYRPNNSSTEARYGVYSSPDLVNWTWKGNKLIKPNTNFWSAGSYSKNGTYYIYYTRVNGSINRDIGVASASSPIGPFTDHGIILDKDRPVIDPSVFKDPNTGKLYLYYAKGVGDGDLPELWVHELANDGLSVISGTGKKILGINQDWENINIEHPLVFYAPNASASHRYYLLYNGSGGHLARYAIGYAYSSSPTGPFTKATAGNNAGDNPVVRRSDYEGIYGPGSPNTMVDDAGTRWLVYRIKTTAAESWSDRVICLDVLHRNSSDKLICDPSLNASKTAPVFN